MWVVTWLFVLLLLLLSLPAMFSLLFQLKGFAARLSLLACYSSQHGRLAMERLGERRIEVRLPTALRPGRARINCTLPARDNRWRWFGYQYYMPRPKAVPAAQP